MGENPYFSTTKLPPRRAGWKVESPRHRKKSIKFSPIILCSEILILKYGIKRTKIYSAWSFGSAWRIRLVLTMCACAANWKCLSLHCQCHNDAISAPHGITLFGSTRQRILQSWASLQSNFALRLPALEFWRRKVHKLNNLWTDKLPSVKYRDWLM